MRKRVIALLMIPAGALVGLMACSDDEKPGGNGPGVDSGRIETSLIDAPADVSKPIDSGIEDAAPLVIKTIVSFNPNFGELPEGIAAVPNAMAFGTPLVSYTPRGVVAAVYPDGGYAPYGVTAPWSPTARSLGLTADSTGAAFLGVGTLPPDGGPVPPVGIYKIPPGGGTPVIFGTAAGMGWPAGIEVVGTDLYVADSNGKIFKFDSAGVGTVWLDDPSLVGNKSACPGVTLASPRPFGAQGLAHDANNLYFTNFDYGALVKVPINANGTAGTPAPVIKGLLAGGTDCTYQSMKGVVIDADGSFLFSTPLSNTIWKSSSDFTKIKVLAKNKPPFDQPSGLVIDTDPVSKKRRLLITNFAVNAKNADAGPLPSIVSIELADAP